MRLRRGDPALALLFKAVQDEHRLLELDGVNRTVRAADAVFDDLQDSGAIKPLENFRRIMLDATLRKVQCVTEELSHRNRQCHQIPLAAANPYERLLRIGHFSIRPERV